MPGVHVNFTTSLYINPLQVCNVTGSFWLADERSVSYDNFLKEPIGNPFQVTIDISHWASLLYICCKLKSLHVLRAYMQHSRDPQFRQYFYQFSHDTAANNSKLKWEGNPTTKLNSFRLSYNNTTYNQFQNFWDRSPYFAKRWKHVDPPSPLFNVVFHLP